MYKDAEVEAGKEYSLVSSHKKLSGKYSGMQLNEALPVQLKKGEKLIYIIQ